MSGVVSWAAGERTESPTAMMRIAKIADDEGGTEGGGLEAGAGGSPPWATAGDESLRRRGPGRIAPRTRRRSDRRVRGGARVSLGASGERGLRRRSHAARGARIAAAGDRRTRTTTHRRRLTERRYRAGSGRYRGCRLGSKHRWAVQSRFTVRGEGDGWCDRRLQRVRGGQQVRTFIWRTTRRVRRRRGRTQRPSHAWAWAEARACATSAALSRASPLLARSRSRRWLPLLEERPRERNPPSQTKVRAPAVQPDRERQRASCLPCFRSSSSSATAIHRKRTLPSGRPTLSPGSSKTTAVEPR